MSWILTRSGRSMITQARLKQLLDYDPETGAFTWITPTSNRAPAGTKAGADSNGYTVIGIDGGSYRAHRLAWLYMTGELPQAHIDHENNDRSDNRWSNLRPATLTQNNRNVGLQSNNSSGFKGVSKHGPSWRAECYADGRRVRKGGFSTQQQAADWIAEVRAQLHGDFANNGRRTAA